MEIDKEIQEDLRCNGSVLDITVGNSSRCQPENGTECYELSAIPPGALITHSFFLVLIGTLSLLANGLVLLLVVKYRRLRSNHSVLLALLLVAGDLSLTITYILPTFVTTIYKRWVFGQAGCIAFGFLAADVLLTRWMIISLFCIDRYCNVKFPFKYQRYRKVILIVLGIAAWLVPAVATAVPIRVFADFTLRTNIPTCLPSCIPNGKNSGLCKIYYAITSFISFFMGSILPTILYCWLYCKGKTARTSIRNSIGQITVQVAGGIIRRPYTDYKSINDRDRRATVTFMLVFITVLVTAAPSFLSQGVRALNFEFHCSIPIYLHFIVLHLLLSASILDPLFIMRDADFRYCLKHLFCCNGTNDDAIGSNSYNNQPPDQIQGIPLENNLNLQQENQSLTEENSPGQLQLPTLDHLELSMQLERSIGLNETDSYTSV